MRHVTDKRGVRGRANLWRPLNEAAMRRRIVMRQDYTRDVRSRRGEVRDSKPCRARRGPQSLLLSLSVSLAVLGLRGVRAVAALRR